jgi:O-methyltransferase
MTKAIRTTTKISHKIRNSLTSLLPCFISDYISMLRHRTYSEDGLMTYHIADFCKDARFLTAYRRGKATGSWSDGDLRWRVYTGCWAAKHASGLPGDFVECGVNRGGLSLSVMEYIDFNSTDKRFFLLDTFRGFPKELCASAASANHDSYEECYADVVETFKPFSGARIIRGKVPDTLTQVTAEQVCFLSIDMNSAEAETAAMRYFWPRLVKGAIVLLDDYAYSESYRRQKEALDLLSKELRFDILALPTGQGLIVKT